MYHGHWTPPPELFGDARLGEYRFHNGRWHRRVNTQTLIPDLPGELVDEQVAKVHSGACPMCGGQGPVDIHIAPYAWSIWVMLFSGDDAFVCCQPCGTRQQIKNSLITLAFGWWSVLGVFVTPIQLWRTMKLFCHPPAVEKPSHELEQLVRLRLATTAVRRQSGHRIYKTEW